MPLGWGLLTILKFVCHFFLVIPRCEAGNCCFISNIFRIVVLNAMVNNVLYLVDHVPLLWSTKSRNSRSVTDREFYFVSTLDKFPRFLYIYIAFSHVSAKQIFIFKLNSGLRVYFKSPEPHRLSSICSIIFKVFHVLDSRAIWLGSFYFASVASPVDTGLNEIF